MFDQMNYISLSGVEYPIRCDILVLEQLQENFGTLDAFEDKVLRWEKKLDENGNPVMKDGEELYTSKLPDVKATNLGLYLMIKEGLLIEGKKVPSYEQLLRQADRPFPEIADEVHKEFANCFKSKNTKTTQENQESQEKL